MKLQISTMSLGTVHVYELKRIQKKGINSDGRQLAGTARAVGHSCCKNPV